MAENDLIQDLTEPGPETTEPAPVETEDDKTVAKYSVPVTPETAPTDQWDEQAEFERLKEEWPEFSPEQLGEVVSQGSAAVVAFEYAAKIVTVRMMTKGLTKEADDPIVVLRNKSESDAVFSAQRYARDFDDKFTGKDSKPKRVARLAGEIVAGDALAAHGHTNLHIKAGTFFKCKVSLARMLIDKGNTNLVIEKYDTKVHDRSTTRGVTLTEDPSMAAIKNDVDRQDAEEAARTKGLEGGYVSPEEGRKMAHPNVLEGDGHGETFGAPDGDFKKEMEPFSKMQKGKGD